MKTVRLFSSNMNNQHNSFIEIIIVMKEKEQ